jgi:hypothetical protein
MTSPADVGVAVSHWSLDDLANHMLLKTGQQRRDFLTSGRDRHVVHFTRGHGSWSNQIEIWFGVLSCRFLRRGEVTSVPDLTEKILNIIAYCNAHHVDSHEWTYAGKSGVRGDKKGKERFRFCRSQLVEMRTG